MNKEKDKKLVNDDKLNLTCIPPDNNRAPNKPKDGVVIDSSYKTFKEPKIENTATDVYYNTECKLPDSEVAIPTYDAVLEAKEWVDEENKK
ncbi:MAG: CDIF630_02480 family spore surface protein [Tissierellaceae bacterium]|jgi:hypothetical protein|nr:DUF3787 domain-containing protein [Tissierellia bacterium]